MSSKITQVDTFVQQQLASRGVTEKTGVYGEHKVQIGQGSPIDLASIKSAKVPFAGFRTATKISRGMEGVQKNAQDALKVLSSRTDTLDAKSLLESLKAAQTHIGRLNELGQLTPAQKQDTMWAFAASVQGLSSAELAKVYQTFTSAEMDLLQTALMREGQTNPKASDARKSAGMLFDLQALVLKEVSNRATASMLKDQQALNPSQGEGRQDQVAAQQTLSEQYGDGSTLPGHRDLHDISDNNLRTIVEVAAHSASTREKTAQAEQKRLGARGIDQVTVRDMADIMRSAELTINIDTRILLGDDSVFAHPDEPMKNIFHLSAEGKTPKGAGYLAKRDSVEQLLFPELGGHDINADERPVYGALNVTGRRTGASPVNYGSAAIILRPEVAKRATYTADDTFYAPRMAISAERRQNFFALLDGQQGIPQGFKDALRNPDSQERKDFNAWLDGLRDKGETSLDALKNTWPASVGDLLHDPAPDVNESNTDSFQALLIRCFGDAKATRSITATHDNLEALIPGLGDVGGNDLARAALNAKNGNNPRVAISGVNYIEAQIQGPVIPSRDIAEIRIDLEDLPRGERERTIARAEDFQNRTGIKVTLFNRSDVVSSRFSFAAESGRISELLTEQGKFNARHIDKTVLGSERQEYLAHLKEHADAYMANTPKLAAGLPAGTLRLEGRALDRLGEMLEDRLEQNVRNTSLNMDARELVRLSFNEAVHPLLKQKAALLCEMEKLPFDTPAQKAAFASWVCSAGDLRSPQEMRVVHKHAMAQASALKEMAASKPVPDAHGIFTTMARLSADASRDLSALFASQDQGDIDRAYIMTQPNRISFMSLAMLQNGEPPFGQDKLQGLHDLINGKEASALLGQMLRVSTHGFLGATDRELLDMFCVQMSHTAENLAKLAGHDYAMSNFVGGLTLIPESARKTLRSTFPGVAQKLDEQYPGFPPFPTPERPASMPRQNQQRRDFLISVLDGYLNHEKTFERGTSVHGRGHVARAYIFASAMCSIMEENGIPVDRNAVLCGIACHDLGRENGGKDYWEGRSADMTVQAMWAAFGSGVMGEEYMREVANSIDSHKGKTLEAMLLNAADSLDIGRTARFDPDKFAFLRGENGEHVGMEAKKIRDQLAVEADLLQRITNPLCANKAVLDKLFLQRVEAANKGNMELARIYGEQREAIESAIEKKFSDDWAVSSGDYMAGFEKVVRDNPQMFPLLSKYYR